MIWTVIEEQLCDKDVKKHAGGKARQDLHDIFMNDGFGELAINCPQIEREESSKLSKLIFHFKIAKEWNKVFRNIKSGDKLVLQFPVINHTLLFNNIIKKLKKRGVEIYVFIHDLELLRMSKDNKYSKSMRWRMKKEEIDELYEFNAVVVHNKHMKDYLCSRFNLPQEKLLVLEIFDYLIPDSFEPKRDFDNSKSCIIAGNLKRDKSAYIYDLPEAPDFELYGVNYETNCSKDNIHYHGSFLPEELPHHLVGGFGLVWDGDSIETCSGAWGEYLKYNNPHKTSLYLACGIPVIIWEEAALSTYVKANNVGITVKSLNEIDGRLCTITEEEYLRYKKNAMTLSEKLRTGFYTRRVLESLDLIN